MGPEALDSAAMRVRLESLFGDWDGFYEATTPVSQADALLSFANAFYHFRCTVEEGWGYGDYVGGGDSEYEVANGVLTSVHDRSECEGRWCCIHNPSAHPMREWPQLWRGDIGLMERQCAHGVGHPDPDDPKVAESGWRMHGCDGCCAGSYDHLDQDGGDTL